MRAPATAGLAPPVIAALDMGYGHVRAASSLASAAGGAVVHADRPPVATETEERAWVRARRLYEGLSRAADAWYLPGARRVLDLVTAIPRPGCGRDPARPTVPARQLERMIRNGLGAGLAAHVRDAGAPLVATFYSAAIAADAHGADRVHLVVTDSDVHRVWVPAEPRRSRIVYFAPTDGAAARLAAYGVPRERLHVTGFPLPPELTEDQAVRGAMARRLAALDREGAFRAARGAEIRGVLGRVPDAAARPVTIVYAVGGAGAQAGVARTLLASLRGPMAAGHVRLVLVAGLRRGVAEDFERWIRDARAGDAAEVLFEDRFPAYYARFNAALSGADVLWTKPSELTFYGALGLPLALAAPLGVHERRNREYALGVGAAIDAGDARGTALALPRLLADGTLAAAAWAGFTRMSRGGTSRILGLAGGA